MSNQEIDGSEQPPAHQAVGYGKPPTDRRFKKCGNSKGRPRGKRRRHAGRANCQVADRRFETRGPAPIYRLTTLLWLHGHGGAAFKVYDDVSPTGKPGGLAMRGRVRNWASFETLWPLSL